MNTAFDCCGTDMVAALTTAQDVRAKFCSKSLGLVAMATTAVTKTTNLPIYIQFYIYVYIKYIERKSMRTRSNYYNDNA